MKNIDLNKIEVKLIELEDNTKAVRRIYKTSFPRKERVAFKDLFAGVFKDFLLYGFYYEQNLLAFVHLNETEEFVYLNYLAVGKKFRSRGIGSYIINWVKVNYNKPIVADVENLDDNAKNKDQRVSRLKFYYKNGFFDGKTDFLWEGYEMYYINTAEISDKSFMKYIKICFPTIKNERKHIDNKSKIKID